MSSSADLVASSALRFLTEDLDDLRERRLFRENRRLPPGAVSLCSNDYLGYGCEPLPAGLAPSGAGASPLVVGYQDAHREGEAALASWLEVETALLFSSGYAANLGVISALLGPGDLVISDALNHASIIDGCRLSGARIVVFPHLDHDTVESTLQQHRNFRRRLVVTESYFSMDADSPNLTQLRRICSSHDAILMVDDAHALGVFGPRGRGLCAQDRVAPDILVGTLGKALGLHGAFVAGSESLRQFLWNRARSLVFSTAISPAVAGAVPGRLARLSADDLARERILSQANGLRRRLAERGWLISGTGPIVPVLVGDAGLAIELEVRLRDAGVVVVAIRPPTVPLGGSRLRMTVTASTSPSTIDTVIETLGDAR